jgi:hypothetical protein
MRAPSPVSHFIYSNAFIYFRRNFHLRSYMKCQIFSHLRAPKRVFRSKGQNNHQKWCLSLGTVDMRNLSQFRAFTRLHAPPEGSVHLSTHLHAPLQLLHAPPRQLDEKVRRSILRIHRRRLGSHQEHHHRTLHAPPRAG